jgi:PAS domain S-box-containing protein
MKKGIHNNDSGREMEYPRNGHPDNRRWHSLLQILRHQAKTINEFLDHALDEAISLTGSKIGYLYIYNEEHREFVLNSWSREVMDECRIANPETCYELDRTGIWGEAVRQAKPIMVNSFQSNHTLKKGYPEGHVELLKYLTVPVLSGEKIVAVIGVANKEADYDDTDVIQLQLLMDATWKIVEQKRAAESEQKLRISLQERVKELKCLADIGRDMQKDMTVEEFCMMVAGHLERGINHSKKSLAIFEVDGMEYPGGKMPAKEARYLSSILRSGNKSIGKITVFNLGETPFLLPEEQELLDQVAAMAALWITRRQMEEQLIKNEKDLHITLQSIGDGVVTTDTTGCVIRMNPTAEQLIRCKLSEAKGRHIEELFSLVNSDTRRKVRNPVNQALKSGKVVSQANHTLMLTCDGRELHVADSAAPIHDENGVLHGVVFVFSDVTGKYEVMEDLRDSEERYRMAFETSPDAININSLEGRFVNVNEGFTRLTGYRREDVIGKLSGDVGIWAVPEDREKLVSELKENGFINNLESSFRCKDGSVRTGLMSARLITIRNERHILSVTKDITTRKRLEVLREIQHVIADAVFSSDDLENLCRVIREEMAAIFDSSSFIIALYDKKTGMFTAPFEECKGEKVNRWPAEKTLSGIVVRENRPLLVTRDEISKMAEAGKINLYGSRAEIWLGVPIRDQESAMGVIILQSYSDPNAYDSYSIQSLELVANQLSAYIDKKNIQEKALKLANAVEQSPVSIVITDLESRIEYVNPRFLEVTGYEHDEVIGQNPRILQSGVHDEKFYNDMYDIVLSGDIFRGEMLNRRKDGELFWERAVISPVINERGEIIKFIGIKEDITDKKSLMEELVSAKERAEESDRLKSAFLANMSHEIRTPMNSIVGFSGLLKSDRLEEEKKNRYIEIINSNADHLLCLIEDIIDISKIETGNIEFHRDTVYIDELFRDLKTRFQAQNTRVEIRYDTNKVDIILGDRVKLSQILSNLIGNALKFTVKGFIEYTVARKDDMLIFKVQDTGTGIRKEDREKIFNRFVQGDRSIWMSRSGTGLGLAIARAYVDKMGGEIWLDSKWGQGSTFWFSIPYLQTDFKVPAVQQSGVDKTVFDMKFKILVAEDDAPGFMLIEEILNEKGAEITHARNGKEAVDHASRYDFDLVLMDIKMPVMDGLEATRIIKSIKPGLPVIAVSAHAFTDEQERALQAGCSNYITKPLYSEELISVISKVMKQTP